MRRAAQETGPADSWFAVSHLSVRYGQAVAITDVSINLGPGEVVAIIGPNGAGKTSLLHAISGIVRPVSGEIWFAGERIDGLAPEKLVRLGIAQVPEGRHLFESMTARENLKIGGYACNSASARADLAAVIEQFPILGPRGRQRAGSLSGGEQQMLAIGRALMARPRLLLLDEPSIGLAPLVVKEITEIVHTISQRYEVGIVLVEQNARLALSIAQRAYVLELGRVVVDGLSSDVEHNEQVRWPI
jgi:branched-chain amino acid transport system ATP-binding protein